MMNERSDHDPEERANIDPEEERELSARADRDPEGGAIRGDRADDEQADSWEAAKIDLRDEEDAARDLESRGKRRSGKGDEAYRGDVLAQPPQDLTGLELGEIKKTAAGLTAVRVTMQYALEEMGPVDGFKLLSKLNQPDGFDCQSCAWADPAPKDRAFMAEYCENGVKVTAEENTRRVIQPEFFERHSVAELSRKSDFWLQKQGRITRPMVLRENATHYEPISWDEAFHLIARELNALESPDEAAFYTSGRTSNEAAFLWQLFVRQLGTNNLPDCSNMCHESSGTALSDAIGIGKGSVTLADLEDTDLIISIGQNPGTCHPRMLTAFQHAKRNGARIVAINPLPETGLNHFKHPQDLKNPFRALNVLVGDGTQLADLYVPVRVVGDVAIMKGILKELLEEEERRPGQVFDHDFIRKYTHGYEAFVEDLRKESWDRILRESGVSRGEIRRVAGMVMEADRVIVSWAMGLTQQPQAVAAIQEIVNLLLVKGSIGRQGAGALPVRGHSNVQGDRTMGIWERMSDQFLDRLGREFSFEPPRHHGYDTVETIRAMHAGKVRVFVGMGGNFLSATPDTEYTAEALRRCRLTAQVSIKLNRGHLVTGRQALILPTIGRAEQDVQATGVQFVTVENSMGVVSPSRGVLDPVSEHLLSEPAVVARMARAVLGERSTVDWEALAADYDRIRDHIARVIPGFEDFNRRIREPGGFYLPHLPRDRREFTTTTGKANFTVHPIHPVQLEPGQLIMMSLRTHDQFNTTVYGLDDRYRGIYNERRVILMNADDIRELGLEAGQVVDLTSHFQDRQRVARQFIVVEFPIPRRCAATYYPEANVLVPIESVAERSNTPTSKFVIITVAPSRRKGRFDYDHTEQAQPLPRA
jgi:molybdopterin-dependent oxidoreductase alpha subunit